MIIVEVLGMAGYAIHPNIEVEERAEILASLPKKGLRIAFIDLAPSQNVVGFAGYLEAVGHTVVSYADHHMDTRNPFETKNTEELRLKLGSSAKLVSRKDAPSSAHLVKAGEWKTRQVDVVFFHADLDGFLGFLKGCGALYPGMDMDADILDGAGRRGQKLSGAGEILANAHEYVVPPFSQDPRRHQETKQRVFQTFANAASNRGTPEEWDAFVGKVRAATFVAVKNARELVEAAELLPGMVVFSDFLPYIRRKEPIAITLWKQGVLERFGETLLCSTGSGHMGEHVFIELPRAWQDQYDLRDFLPEGIRGRVPFRAQVPLSRWKEFFEKWRARSPKN